MPRAAGAEKSQESCNMKNNARRNRRKNAKLRVGVTLFIREGQQSLWENGIFQNCHFLLMLLERSPRVERCFVVNGGPGSPENTPGFLANAVAPVIHMDEAMDQLDVIIELSAQLNPEWAKNFKARGGCCIGMRVANDYIIDAERMMYNLPHGLLFSGVPYDQTWTLPAFSETNESYYRVGSRAPVRVMQHLWNPMLLERALSDYPEREMWGYRPGRDQWRLSILEPNICSVKTCHLPLLACEEAYRRNPGVIEAVRAYNTMQLKEHDTFVKFALTLDIVKNGIATFEPRLPIFEILTRHGDAIVSHHWHNAQNYLYYEALYGGYPLIHNSDLLGDAGYRYANFDSEDAGLAILQAHAAHDVSFDDYRAKAATLLTKLDPLNPENIHTYTQTIEEAIAA